MQSFLHHSMTYQSIHIFIQSSGYVFNHSFIHPLNHLHNHLFIIYAFIYSTLFFSFTDLLIHLLVHPFFQLFICAHLSSHLPDQLFNSLLLFQRTIHCHSLIDQSIPQLFIYSSILFIHLYMKIHSFM